MDYGSTDQPPDSGRGRVQCCRSCGLRPGTAVTRDCCAPEGVRALLESGEFSWASLDFEKGRLVVEAAPARARPEIAAGTLHGLQGKGARDGAAYKSPPGWHHAAGSPRADQQRAGRG
ncbi:MAG: hypothetical protein ACLVJH_19335 [Faecalibacterium prausnitzii]